MSEPMSHSKRRIILWLVALALTVASTRPGRADALVGDWLLGPELHLPWSAGARLEWQPLDLVEPSISLGFVPKGAVNGLRGVATGSPDALTFALRITSQPIPLLGLSFNAALRTFVADRITIPALELGIGWRLKIFGIAWAAEVGAFLGDGMVAPYVGLGAFWIFHKG